MPWMQPFERHIFVCENRRPAESSKGCCARIDGAEIRQSLKVKAFEAGLRGKVRVNSAGCLGFCELGVTVVVYPDAVWYGHVQLSDVDEIFEEHVLNGRPVERLRIESPAGEPAALNPASAASASDSAATEPPLSPPDTSPATSRSKNS